jgi:hypothetical protein
LRRSERSSPNAVRHPPTSPATIRHSQPWVDYGYDDNWYPAEIFKTLADSDDDTEEFKIEKITDYKRVHNQVSY